jgi:hypothetical protein
MSVEQVNTVEASAIEQTNSGGKGNRSFKVKLEENGQLYGRYNGDSPYQAANKALSEIIRNKVKNGGANDDSEITFFLVESTKGSAKKTHQYSGRRIKLDTPVSYKVGDNHDIVKEYKNVLRKMKKVVQVGGTANVAQVDNTQPTILSTQNTTNGSTIVVSTTTTTV